MGNVGGRGTTMTDTTRANGHVSSHGDAATIIALPKEGGAMFASAGRPLRAAASDPTDPEVPNAKRKRDARRRRSFVLAGSAVVGLVLFVLFLIWKTGRQVTSGQLPESSSGGPAALSVERRSNALEPAPARALPTSSVEAQAAAPPAPPSVDRPNVRKTPRAPASASDLFRQPGF